MNLVVVAAICAMPAVAFTLFARAFDWFVRHPGRPVAIVRNDAADLERFRANLRRLAAEHDRLMVSETHGKMTRLRAVQLAYDDTLRQAGALLDLRLPDSPMPTVGRLQAEAELAAHGFVW